MTRSKVKVKVTRPLKLEIFQFSKSILRHFNVNWQMTTDSETTEQYLTFVRSRFLISVIVFVSHDFELGRVSVQFANAFAIAITFARWRRRSEEATAVPYGANYYYYYYYYYYYLSVVCYLPTRSLIKLQFALLVSRKPVFVFV